MSYCRVLKNQRIFRTQDEYWESILRSCYMRNRTLKINDSSYAEKYNTAWKADFPYLSLVQTIQAYTDVILAFRIIVGCLVSYLCVKNRKRLSLLFKGVRFKYNARGALLKNSIVLSFPSAAPFSRDLTDRILPHSSQLMSMRPWSKSDDSCAWLHKT